MIRVYDIKMNNSPKVNRRLRIDALLIRVYDIDLCTMKPKCFALRIDTLLDKGKNWSQCRKSVISKSVSRS